MVHAGWRHHPGNLGWPYSQILFAACNFHRSCRIGTNGVLSDIGDCNGYRKEVEPCRDSKDGTNENRFANTFTYYRSDRFHSVAAWRGYAPHGFRACDSFLATCAEWQPGSGIHILRNCNKFCTPHLGFSRGALDVRYRAISFLLLPSCEVAYDPNDPGNVPARVQIMLGAITIWTSKAVTPTTLHVSCGAAILGTMVYIMVRSRHILAPKPAFSAEKKSAAIAPVTKLTAIAE